MYLVTRVTLGALRELIAESTRGAQREIDRILAECPNLTTGVPVRWDGESMKTIRRESRWSQMEVAESVGICRQTVQSYESGESCPTVDMAIFIAGILGVRLEDLVLHTPSRNRKCEATGSE